jgi:hypothetical protein
MTRLQAGQLRSLGSIPSRGIMSRLTLGPTQPLVQWVPGVLSLRIKSQVCVCEADHSPPSSAEVKNGGVVLPLYYISSWRGA